MSYPKRIIISIAAVFVVTALHPVVALAHQPVFIATSTPIAIPDADTSRAYYGELVGHSAIYSVTLPQQMSFYLNILSPYIQGAQKDFSVRITDTTGTLVATLNAPGSEWKQWYEEFAGDTYWKGPEFKQELPTGTYTIEVSNPSESGKYVLAPGEAETFTLAGTPRTIAEIYTIKTAFFGKPWYSIYQGIIGKTLLGLTLVIALLIGLLLFFLYRRMAKG